MNLLNTFFRIKEKNSNLWTELIGGFSTFASMAYVIIVNAEILKDAGLNPGSTMVATIVCTAFACLLMGFLANEPISIAPGMGVSALVAYTLVASNGYPVHVALLGVFFAGLVLLLLNMLGIRQKILESIPKHLLKGIMAGVGLFLIAVGFKQMDFILPNPGGGLIFNTIAPFKLACGLLGGALIVWLMKKGVKAAFILVIFGVWALSLTLGLSEYQGIFATPPALDLSHLDVGKYSLNYEMATCFFSVFLITLFDSSAGILILREMLYPESKSMKMQRALTPDALGSMLCASLGITSLAIHIESTAGIQAGSRTGLSTIVTGLIFLLCLFLYPLVESMPTYASAPALIAIGYLMIAGLKGFPYRDFSESIPAFAACIIMPITFSIYHGFAVGFLLYMFMKVITRQIHQLSVYHWMICSLFIFHWLLF